MKKLLIAAALICSAVAVQAAAFTWKTNVQAYGPSVANLTAESSGTYGIGSANGDRMKAENTNNGVTWTYAMILTCGAESENLSGTVTSYGSNKINQSINSTLFSLPTDDSTKTYSWDIVITGTKTTEAGTYTYVSDHITGSRDFTSLTATEITTAAPTSWTITVPTTPTPPQPIPEPTSGLLLVLGLAGLALRRKRA